MLIIIGYLANHGMYHRWLCEPPSVWKKCQKTVGTIIKYIKNYIGKWLAHGWLTVNNYIGEWLAHGWLTVNKYSSNLVGPITLATHWGDDQNVIGPTLGEHVGPIMKYKDKLVGPTLHQ